MGDIIETYGIVRTVCGLIFVLAVFAGIVARWIMDEPSIIITTKNHQKTVPQNIDTNYAFSYMKVPLLTNRETKQYYVLKEITDSKNLLIFPKVRLMDLIAPKPGIRNIRGLKAKVMSKHVDFTICDQSLNVIAIIELDDSTHLRPDRKKRDQFVDSVLFGAGYRVIHTWAITSEILDFYQ